MNEELKRKLKVSSFGNNKYYIKIIECFINEFSKDNIRVIIDNNNINIKITDLVGSKIVNFNILNGYLQVKMDKTVNFVKYQDIILYDDLVMIERTNCKALLKKDINEKFKNKLEILAYEFDKLGQDDSIYTGMIFDSVYLRVVKRLRKSELIGTYMEKNVLYDKRGERSGKRIEGTFDILNESGISTLDFPKEDNIVIIKEDNLNDKDILFERQFHKSL